MVNNAAADRRTGLAVLIAALLLALLIGTGCGKSDNDETSQAAPPAPKPKITEIVFAYTAEMEKWVSEGTAGFNATSSKLTNGKVVHVTALPMTSHQTIVAALNDRDPKPDVICPASNAFLELGNAQARNKYGRDLVSQSRKLLTTPMVIAMWKPMAEALGWGKQPLGWKDFLDLIREPQGWGKYGNSQWGVFKLAHPHPEYNDAGLFSIVSEVYAANTKTRDLTDGDLKRPQTVKYISDLESSVVCYGDAPDFFADHLYKGTANLVSAAVMRERDLIQLSSRKDLPFPVVAIYPKEGTFNGDCPVAIVQRPWVTPEHQEAAHIYINYLLAYSQQANAMAYGFRPADTSIALVAPIDADHGVDPGEPRIRAKLPVEQLDGILQLWHKNKKRASVVLVFDTSSSMSQQNRVSAAREAATRFIDALDDRDTFSLLGCGTTPQWLSQDLLVGSSRDDARKAVSGLSTGGNALLYDAIDMAASHLQAAPQGQEIRAIVVLSGGKDTGSAQLPEDLLRKLHTSADKQPINVFTIGFGGDAPAEVLKKLSDETQGDFRAATVENVREIFEALAAFF